MLFLQACLICLERLFLLRDGVELLPDAVDQLSVMIADVLDQLELIKEVGKVLRAHNDLQRADVTGNVDGLDALAQGIHIAVDLRVRFVDRLLLLGDILVIDRDLLVAYLDLGGHGFDLTDQSIDLFLLLSNRGIRLVQLSLILRLLRFQLRLAGLQFADRRRGGGCGASYYHHEG